MKIECLTPFLHGRDRFESGDVRTVPDEDGAIFVTAGWARDISGIQATGAPAEGVTDLAIHNARHEQIAKVGD